MVRYCCAYGCKETFIKGGSITFHSFPNDDQRRKVWEVQLRRENFKATKYSKICSKHFTEDCFDRLKFGGTWLKADAVPTIFNFPDHLQKTVKKRNTVRSASVAIQNEAVDCDNIQGPSGIQSKKRKRLHYLGDFNEDDVTSPSKAVKCLNVAKEQTADLKKKIKNLTKQNANLRKQVSSLKELLDDLRNNNLISDNASTALEVSGSAKEFIKRFEGNYSREAYPIELKTFALTLNFYSAKAYNYVRDTFNCNLPHPSTLREWYKHVDGSPGITGEALTALKIKAEEASKIGKIFHCGLIVDEVAIRKHVEWDKDQFSGYINVGTNLDNDQLPYAKEALTFMINSLNGNWKVPVAYFLINGLSASERSNLITEALHFIHETGVNVVSLTFDGTSTNIATANALGADISVDNLINFFPHPVTKKNIYIILDPCHMLKLVRNCLASKGSMVDGDEGLINWQHIVNLEKFQVEEGLHAATKLRKRHIEWQREKMKVKLAAQVLSKSVADALAYLAFDLKHPLFINSGPTIEFVKIFNDLFDVLNSKNLRSKQFKAPIQPQNKDAIMSFLNEAEIYIQNLSTSVNGEKILFSNRKTGFLGFLVCIRSIKALYHLLCENKENGMHFLMTYKLSQDHLELFFSAVRSRGGHNNNPTAKQFKTAYIRLLTHHQIMTSDSANCIILDNTNILNLSNSTNMYINSINATNTYEIKQYSTTKSVQDDHTYAKSFKQLSKYVTDVVAHIAGFVTKKLKLSIKCRECINSLSGESFGPSTLSLRKNRGGLNIPSQSIIKVCKIGETFFRITQASGKLSQKNIMHSLISKSLAEILESNIVVFDELDEHSTDHGSLDNHKMFLMKAVLFEYFKIRLYHAGKMITEAFQGNKVRSLNSKNTIFSGQ